MIQILSGCYKGRRLRTPKHSGIRPTTARVRQSLMDRLQPELPGARVLDGFAGTGAIGLECLSRGADFVAAIEKNRDHYQLLTQNYQSLNLDPDQYALVCDPFIKTLKRMGERWGPFDVVYLDPPYGYEALNQSIRALLASPCFGAGSLLLVEHHKEDALTLPSQADLLRYGETQIHWYQAD